MPGDLEGRALRPFSGAVQYARTKRQEARGGPPPADRGPNIRVAPRASIFLIPRTPTPFWRPLFGLLDRAGGTVGRAGGRGFPLRPAIRSVLLDASWVGRHAGRQNQHSDLPRAHGQQPANSRGGELGPEWLSNLKAAVIPPLLLVLGAGPSFSTNSAVPPPLRGLTPSRGLPGRTPPSSRQASCTSTARPRASICCWA